MGVLHIAEHAFDPGALDNAELRDRLRHAWHQQGFVVLRGVLDREQVDTVLAAVDVAVAHRREAQREHHSYANDRDHSVRVRNAAATSVVLARLVDHPRVLPAVEALLGDDAAVLGTEAFVRHGSDAPMEAFHTDGGASLLGIVLDERSSHALQLKVQLFLTDLSEPDRGNFALVPGSHRRRPERLDDDCHIGEANDYVTRGVLPPDAIQILASPGDAVVFPHSLWHGVAPNRSRRSRRSVIIRYGHLWCRPIDFFELPPAITAELTDRQRRMFGDLGPDSHPADYYKPTTAVRA